MLKIFGFLKSDGGCDWYRVKQPLVHIAASKEAQVRFFYKGDDFEWFGSDEAAGYLEEALAWCDIMLIPRISEDRLVTVLKTFQKMGKKIVTELDDDLFKVSPLTQQYRHFGIEEYSHDLNGEKIEVWKDGKNIDLARNKEARKRMMESLRASDMLLTTTDDLAKVYQPHTNMIRVCPNSVNINMWKKLPLVPHQGIRMGWFGGDTHYHDWLLIAPVLKAFMEQNKDVTLVLLGAKFDGTLKGIDPTRIEHHNWTETPAYPYKAAILDLDFAVIPLVDNAFNNGKSPIKWLEMGALEVPSVTSYVKPYTAMMDLVPDNGIFVEGNSHQGWWDSMNLLSRDAELRKRMGKAARKTVEDHYDANKTWRIWLKAFEDCMAQKPIEHEKVELGVS